MSLCAVVLAAGVGRRLRPLTSAIPKALCPVGNVPLLDRALAAMAGLGIQGTSKVAVNAWHQPAEMVRAVGERAHMSVETTPAPLGSAGGLAALRNWIGGRDVLVGNSDAYLRGGSLAPLLDGWDGAEVRMLGVPAGDRPVEFGPYRFAGFSLLPWRWVADLPVEPADLVRAVWRPAERAGALRVIEYAGVYIDSGTPRDYLMANLDAARAAGGSLIDPDATISGAVLDSVIGAGAMIDGVVERCVVLPGAVVRPHERLVETIRHAYGPDLPASLP